MSDNHSKQRWFGIRLRLGSVILLASCFVVIGLFALRYAAGGSVVTPTPVLVTGPSGRVTSTTATFTYRNSYSPVSYRCRIDANPWRSCAASGVTYTSLAEGTHKFSVVARSSIAAESAAASRSWIIDRTAPSRELTFPRSDAEMNNATWKSACGSVPGICGSARDAAGVAKVEVALRRSSTGLWWTGSSFSGTSAKLFLASGTGAWNLPLARPPDGTYQLLVRATDKVGNAKSVTTGFTVDTVRPVVEFTSLPESPTTARKETIEYFANGPVDSFDCVLDGAPTDCSASSVVLDELSIGRHCLTAVLFDRAGNGSVPITTCWVVATDVIGVRGIVSKGLSPGSSAPVDIVITNPHPFPISVASVAITVDDETTRDGAVEPDCAGSSNFAIAQNLMQRVIVPADSERSLSDLGVPTAAWPRVEMLNLATNQDSCQGVTVSLTLRGAAST